MRLSDVLSALDSFAPVRHAQSWDNVGLLVDGPPDHEVRSALICIDLTPRVLDEAVAAGVELVVGYHPLVFGGLKRLTHADPQQATVLRAVRSGIAVYAPHTALDAAPGGMSDWLLDAVGLTRNRAPLAPVADHPAVGAGRVAELVEPVDLPTLLPRIKEHLGLSAVRVATPGAGLVRRVAVCPGAGGSLFEPLRDVDLLLTGEMRHHDVLGRVASGTHVVLTDHTNTERGYLPTYADRLREVCPGVSWAVSRVDRDPLEIR